MNKNENKTVENVEMQDKLLKECIISSKFALGRGRKVKPEWVQAITNYQKDQNNENNLENLTIAHNELSKLIWPVTPERAVSWIEQDGELGFNKSGVPFMLIFKLKICSLISILFFLGMSMCKVVHEPIDELLKIGGWQILLTMLYYISAAGIGASFTILNKVNMHMKNKTFKDNHEHSYFIRFILGLIAGLLLAMILNDKLLTDKNGIVIFNDYILRPLMAILGGFSAELLNTFLIRLVETLRSLFLGSNQSFIDSEIQKVKLKQEKKNFGQNLFLKEKVHNIINNHASDSTISKELETLLDDYVDDYN